MDLFVRYHKLLRTCVVTVFMVMAAFGFASPNDQHTMLIINSYSENAPWSQSFARPINDKLAQYPDVHLDMISLNSSEIHNQRQYDEMVEKIFQSFSGNPPKYVIMIGNFAFTLRDRIRQEWGDVPILLLSRIDRYAPLNYYFAGYKGNSDWEDLPLLSDVRYDYNMTAIVTPDFCGEDVELMRKVVPGLRKIVFISDNEYANRSFNLRLRQYLDAHHPDLDYEWLQANDSTVHVFQNYMLNKQPGTAFIIGTWSNIDRGGEVHAITGGNIHMISSAANPVFALMDSYLAFGAFGGVYHDLDAGSEALEECIGAMLEGKGMSTLPLYVFDKGVPVINHQRMQGLGYRESDFPQETRYIFRAPTVWEAYGNYIIFAALLLLLLIIGDVVYLTIQRKRITLLKTHALFIKYMPWAYSKARLLYDRKGKIFDIDYINESMNEEFANLLAENHLPNYDDKIFPYDFIAEKATQVVETGAPVKFTYHFPSTDKYYDILLCRITPEQLRPGERPHDIDVFANDITDTKKQEEALIAAKERANESDRMKSAFLANMSHEIRTPLNAIVGFSSLLTQTDVPEEKARYASIIEHNNDLLLHLINDVLDLAKIESNTMQLQMIDTDLNDLMQSLYDTVRLRIAPGVLFNMVLGAEECHFKTDPNRLSQVLINLLTNAAKFTTKGNITYGYEINGDEIEFFVRDTGIGIPKEDQGKLFQRFSKLNDFMQGTGLGLSICKSFIEKMGGTIGVKSRGEGKGSTFWFTLPYVRADKQEPLTVTEGTVMERSDREGDQVTILVAEDVDSNYLLYDSILSKSYRLVRARTGNEAVEMYDKFKPDLVLMDIRLPDMDGYEVTKTIRSKSQTVPIIAVTGHISGNEKDKILKSGFNSFVAKPINSADLLNAVKAQLNKRFYVF